MNIEKIKVEYIDHMGSDLKVVNCARASFDKTSELDKAGNLKQADVNLINFLARGCTTQEWDELAEEAIAKGGDREAYLGNPVAEMKEMFKKYKASAVHFAPFCHCSVTLRLTIPVFTARQLVKHQIGMTWSEVSRRYVSDEPSFWFPEVWHTRPENVKQGSGEAAVSQHLLRFCASDAVENSLESYKALLSAGVAPEEARIVLPLNHMTTVVWTGTLLAWTRVGNQRLDPHAQLATQEAAKGIQDIVKPLFPVSWDALVAY